MTAHQLTCSQGEHALWSGPRCRLRQNVPSAVSTTEVRESPEEEKEGERKWRLPPGQTLLGTLVDEVMFELNFERR